jgi:hypothetical protein
MRPPESSGMAQAIRTRHEGGIPALVDEALGRMNSLFSTL